MPGGRGQDARRGGGRPAKAGAAKQAAAKRTAPKPTAPKQAAVKRTAPKTTAPKPAAKPVAATAAARAGGARTGGATGGGVDGSDAGGRIYQKAFQIWDDLEAIIRGTEREFIAMGVSFDVSLRNLRDAYEDRLRRGVRVTFVGLSEHADFGLFAPQFGQSVDELRREVGHSYAEIRAVQQRFPGLVRFYPTKRCPNFRIYVSDPHGDAPHGIINFYGASTDSPHLPAWRIANFRTSWTSRYYADTLAAVERTALRKVFIIHGRAEAKWRELEKIVREFGLDPVVLREQADVGAWTVIDKFEKHARECSLAIALFTPDDWVESGGRQYFQARPNALYEFGWFCAHLGRAGVILMLQGSDVVLPSDLGGFVELRFVNDVSERYAELRKALVALELIE